MTKKFNKFIYYLSVFVRILDKELSFRFNDNKNRDSGLPPELENLSMEKYYEVFERIRSFKREVKNNQKATLKLSSEELNLLGIFRYKYYSEQTEKHKSWSKTGYYEIRNNILIGKTIYNLYFLTRKMWRDEVCIHIWVEDGIIKQKKKVIYKLNQEYDGDEYKEVSSVHQSKLINFIFLPYHRTGISIRNLDPETASIIEKIKSIDVIENKLVITG
ncbi:MAG: hypothetical protein ACRC2S_24555 [Waterburya sp.]